MLTSNSYSWLSQNWALHCQKYSFKNATLSTQIQRTETTFPDQKWWNRHSFSVFTSLDVSSKFFEIYSFNANFCTTHWKRDRILYHHFSLVQYDHLELSKSKRFLYSNQPTKVDSDTCPDFVYIYHLCFKSNLASYQSFQSPREGGVIKSEKSMLQSKQLNFGTENRK